MSCVRNPVIAVHALPASASHPAGISMPRACIIATAVTAIKTPTADPLSDAENVGAVEGALTDSMVSVGLGMIVLIVRIASIIAESRRLMR